MKTALPFLVCGLAAMASAVAQQTIVLQTPRDSGNVVSPLTTSTAASGQVLLDQISNTLQQRSFERQVLSLQTTPVAPATTTRTIIVK